MPLYQSTLEAASAYVAGDWSACGAAAAATLDQARRRGHRFVEFWAVHQLGRLALAEDDLPGAENLLGHALELGAGQHRRMKRWSSPISRSCTRTRVGFRKPVSRWRTGEQLCAQVKTGAAWLGA